MNTLKIKHREFEVIEEKGNNVLIANFKNKQYEIIGYDSKSREGQLLIYSLERIHSSPISSPKLCWIDKKAGYIVREHFATENIMDILAKQDLSESIYDQLFKNAYFARSASMTIDYSPNVWGLKDGTLYYLGYSFTPFSKENDLVDKYLRLWFNTRELAQFLKNKGVFYDKSREKNEYEVNKEIVLMTCKYYR